MDIFFLYLYWFYYLNHYKNKIHNNDLAKKQASITGGASTITSSNLTTSRALISNSSGKVAVSDVTSTELGYLDGVTSAIQTQLNGKQANLGFTPVQQGGGTNQLSNKIRIGWNGTQLLAQVDNTSLGAFCFGDLSSKADKAGLFSALTLVYAGAPGDTGKYLTLETNSLYIILAWTWTTGPALSIFSYMCTAGLSLTPITNNGWKSAYNQYFYEAASAASISVNWNNQCNNISLTANPSASNGHDMYYQVYKINRISY